MARSGGRGFLKTALLQMHDHCHVSLLLLRNVMLSVSREREHAWLHCTAGFGGILEQPGMMLNQGQLQYPAYIAHVLQLQLARLSLPLTPPH